MTRVLACLGFSALTFSSFGALAQQGPAAPVLPEPYATPSVVNYPVTSGWPEGMKPKAPAGFEVVEFARGLDSPRQILVLPNGDVLAAEATTVLKPKPDAAPHKTRGQAASRAAGTSADRIILLRDADGDGVAETRAVLVENLNQPFGMAALGGKLYVADTDGLVSFPFKPGETRIDAAPTRLMDLPAGGYNNHWTRNLLASPDGKTLYVSVGSASNVGEHGMEVEQGRAAIHAYDIASGGSRIYASGLRNPVGMDFAPDGKTL